MLYSDIYVYYFILCLYIIMSNVINNIYNNMRYAARLMFNYVIIVLMSVLSFRLNNN